MALAPRLDLRQSQSLVMTPQLQQAIRLLTLSNLELEAVLAEELASNPLLEQASDHGEVAAPPVDDRAQGTDQLFDAGIDAGAGALDVDFAAETFHHDSGSDTITDRPSPAAEGEDAGGPTRDFGDMAGGSDSGAGGEAVDFDSFRAADTTLRDHLLHQAGERLSGVALLLAQALIETIDEAGYTDADLSEMALRLGVARSAIEAALATIQTFDPAGVGARSLSECLAIQAREADRYDPCMAKLIDNLDLLARGQIRELRRLCRVDEEDMADMIRELRGYDPKPGLRFGSDAATPVVPDIFVRPIKTGWAIEINNATLPRLLVNRQYYTEMSGAVGKGAARTWLSDCLASANWLVKSLDQRQQTIIKVTEEIVRQQEGFFLHGVSALKPLTLARVADAIGMHESTVSRVTSNKYLSCPRGLFELKYFFKSGVASADSDDGMSAEAVKAKIKALIDGESGNAILSDDTLVDLLKAQGCDIARRTVAKYREAMGIGSSVQRRRAKALGM
jgi:RNA polymerase sigma-54 factor